MRRALWIACGVLMPIVIFGGPTPMDAPLKEGGITMIECDVQGRPEKIITYKDLDGGKENAALSKKLTGYHYRLYVPHEYSKNKDHRYAVMFIAHAGGNATMIEMEARLKGDDWVVVMLVESKNGSKDWLNNFTAAHDDVIKRVRVAAGAKFATGYSGGARCASMFPTVRPGFRGIICQAAGFLYGFEKIDTREFYQKYPTHVLVAGTFGDGDGNRGEGNRMRRLLPAASPKYIEYFKGGHSYGPKDTFERAMDWMEEGSFLSKPVKPKDCKLFSRNAKAEALGKDAHLWYFRATQKRLAAAASDADKYIHLKHLIEVAKHARLAYDPAYKKVVGSAQRTLLQLRRKRDVGMVVRAETDYKKAVKAWRSFAARVQRTGMDPREKGLSKSERKLLDTYRKAAGKVITKYPDTYYGKRLKAYSVSVDLEFGTK